jgi:hypothetical protein
MTSHGLVICEVFIHCSKNNFSDKRNRKDKSCNAEGTKLIYFCETNNFKIFNGKFGSDTIGEFTSIIKICIHNGV